MRRCRQSCRLLADQAAFAANAQFTDTLLRNQVTHCDYAEFMEQIGARDLGELLICNSDFAMADELGAQVWCHPKGFSLADIAVGVALGYLDFRFPQIDWRTPYPNLHKLYDKLAQRPSFQDTQPG